MALKKKIKRKGMRCPRCLQPGEVVALCAVVVRPPLAKGGGIKMGGIPVNHKVAKESWEAQGLKLCQCNSCDTVLTYTKGSGLKAYAFDV